MNPTFFDIKYFFSIFVKILSAINITLSLAFISLILSLIIGVFSAISEFYNIKFFKTLSRVYVSIFRGTPLLPQLFFFYFGIAYFSETVRNLSAFTATAIVLSLNMGSYMSENIRGALKAIDKGQIEAAESLGLSNWQTMRRILAPQAFRIAFPSLFNNFIDLIKGSSISFVVGVPDIMGMGKIESAKTFRFFEGYASVMLIYWCIINLLTIIQRKIEYRLNSKY